jgi:hypothetical protein
MSRRVLACHDAKRLDNRQPDPNGPNDRRQGVRELAEQRCQKAIREPAVE